MEIENGSRQSEQLRQEPNEKKKIDPEDIQLALGGLVEYMRKSGRYTEEQIAEARVKLQKLAETIELEGK